MPQLLRWCYAYPHGGSLGLMQGLAVVAHFDSLSFLWLICPSQTVGCDHSAGSLELLGARMQKRVNGPGR